MQIWLQIGVNGLLTAAIYALIAAGISFLYGTTKIFHLAHGVVVLGGGYAFWWAWLALGWPAWLAAVLSLALAAAVGLTINEWVYEVLRRRGAKGLSYLISTLAVLVFGTALVILLFGAAPKTFHFQTATLTWAGVGITQLQIMILLIASALLAFFFWLTQKTILGKAMRATADNETVAEILGIPTRNIRRLAFALSSLLAAAAGILIGLEFNLDPNMGILLAVKGYTAAVIGGVGSFGGALLGALIIGGVEQVVVWFWGSGWRSASTFIILFLFLLFRPQGLFGQKRET